MLLVRPGGQGTQFCPGDYVYNTPSIPTGANVSHSLTVVDGPSTHAADSRRAVNADSSTAVRRRYSHPVVSVPDGHSRSSRQAAAPRDPQEDQAPGKLRGVFRRRT
ncbi:hypothetical protein [Streptomyces sp. NPDC046759]|uniref:hypothetical protein n=1 Tax=Streptomyces sp. NPDC046759 TaxID=3155019 RepID=UPI0033C2ECE0